MFVGERRRRHRRLRGREPARPPKLGFDAELSAIYLAADSQAARASAAGWSAAVAARSASAARPASSTWVIANNKDARAFYERLGGELLVEQPFQWDGLDLVEAGYGWRDLDALAAAAGPTPPLH